MLNSHYLFNLVSLVMSITLSHPHWFLLSIEENVCNRLPQFICTFYIYTCAVSSTIRSTEWNLTEKDKKSSRAHMEEGLVHSVLLVVSLLANQCYYFNSLSLPPLMTSDFGLSRFSA